MRIPKERVTLTIDAALVRAANVAVEQGRADSVSGWANRALAEFVAKERRLEALAEAVAAYEREFGAITRGEVAAQLRADEKTARAVRGRRRAKAARTSRAA